jgi:putative ATPase
VRDRLFELAQLQRHHVVLNLNAGSGLLVWEAARQVPEGGVYACAYQSADADMLREQALALTELLRPMAIAATLSELPAKLAAAAPDVHFDCILGHNALMRSPDKTASLRSLANLLLPDGAMVLYETIPRYTQRIYCLIETELLKARLNTDLYQRWAMAEEAIYKQDSDPMLNWDASDLAAAFATVGLSVEIETQQVTSQMHIAPALMERWFSPSSPSYASYLSQYLSAAEVTTIEELLTRHLLHKTVAWEGKGVFVRGRYLADRSP